MEDPVGTLLPVCAPIVAGLLFCSVALYFWRGGREMRERGASAQVRVVKKFRQGGGIESYYGLREGDSKEITYLPGRPETAEMTPLWGKRLFGGILLFFAAVGGLMAIIGLVSLVRILAGWLRT